MAALTPRPDDWIESAPVVVEVIREIDASPETIWSVLADHERWPDWFPAARDVAVTGPASGVGARRRVRLPGVTVDEEFVAWDVAERFAFTVVAFKPGVLESLNERVTIVDLGGGRSRVTYTQGFAPRPWFRVPMKLVRGLFERGLCKGVDGLAARVV